MKYILLTIALTLSSLSIQATDITGISEAFKAGDVSELVAIVNEEADLTILKTTTKCDGTEAVELLNAFLEANKPSDFKVLHHADKNDSGFFVGRLITESKEYRVNVTYTVEEDKLTIQSIRIE